MEDHVKKLVALVPYTITILGISMGQPILNLQKLTKGFLQLTLFSLYLALSLSLYRGDRHNSSFHIPFSINCCQHSRFRHLEIAFSCSLPLSLSLSLSPNTHHICVDSQLARSIWTVTVFGSNSGFPKICLIDYSLPFFHCELRVECEVLRHRSSSAG